MKATQHKIAAQKRAIRQRRADMTIHVAGLKHKLFASSLTLPVLAGLVVGFILVPKKYKVIKGVLKTFALLSTVKQVVDALPGRKASSKYHHQPISTRLH